MEIDLNFEQMLNFPDKLKQESNKYSDLNGLLSENIIKKYDYVTLELKIKRCIINFQDARYLFERSNSSAADNIRITSSYTNFVKSNHIVDAVCEIVRKYNDRKMWAKKLYSTLLYTAPKLTYFEVVYFVDRFFYKMSEDAISKKLFVSRNYLRDKIRPSCLIKIWWEAAAVIEEDFD